MRGKGIGEVGKTRVRGVGRTEKVWRAEKGISKRVRGWTSPGMADHRYRKPSTGNLAGNMAEQRSLGVSPVSLQNSLPFRHSICTFLRLRVRRRHSVHSLTGARTVLCATFVTNCGFLRAVRTFRKLRRFAHRKWQNLLRVRIKDRHFLDFFSAFKVWVRNPIIRILKWYLGIYTIEFYKHVSWIFFFLIYLRW